MNADHTWNYCSPLDHFAPTESDQYAVQNWNHGCLFGPFFPHNFMLVIVAAARNWIYDHFALTEMESVCCIELEPSLKSDPTALWATLILSLHEMEQVWKLFPVKCELTGVWKNITNVLKELAGANLNVHDLFTKEMGRGTHTAFWHEDWSGSSILKEIFPLLFRLESKKQCCVSDRYKRIGAAIQWTWGWKRAPTTQEENI
ncbi:hypothetical protein LXL04_013198 [Taraxacum kok-saghyz]